MHPYHEIENWLIAWLQSSYHIPRNRWFNIHQLEVYMRVHHLRSRADIDVANINLPENIRSQGHYTRFLDWLEERAPKLHFETIKLENVLEKRLISYYIRRNYQVVQDHDVDYGVVSFIKKL